VIVFLFHAIFATGIAFVLSSLYGALTPLIAVVSLVIGFWMGRRRGKAVARVFPDLRFFRFARGESGSLEVMLSILVLYVSARHFLWMHFEADSNVMTLHPNNFGDLPLHINYIRQMAGGLIFPPVNPEYSSEALRYPFGPDLYNALWEILGVPLSSHLFVVGMLATVACLTILRWFGGWWAVGAFFLSGGLAGWASLRGVPLRADLLQDVDWKNLFLSVYITQRGVLFALPVGIFLIEASRRIFAGEVKPTKTVMTSLGLLWGILPLFHAHAFVIVSLIMGFNAINARRSLRGLKELLTSRMAWFAYLPAICFILRTSDGLKKASIVHWDPWWTSSFAEAPNFMLQNFGPWLLLPIAIAIAVWRAKRRDLAYELLIYFGLFAFFFNVMIAPWSWDNIKVLIFPYLGFARLAWVSLDQRIPGFAKYIVAFILFFSGFLAIELSLAPPTQKGLAVYNLRDLANMEGALKDVPKNAVFASGTTHNHSLTNFGRVRAVGYEGHLWSHGVIYQPRIDLLNRLMKATPETNITQVAHDLGVTHIVWGPEEKSQFQNEPVWPSTFKNVSRVEAVQIFEVLQ
jgi:hypothetical protein